MAQRRMFSRSVVRTDQFLEMPQTAQNLYFHLGMEPDDDGFVNPRMIMRTIGSNDDDLKLLIAKGFVIQFPTGVIVIRHWRQNNYIQKDRYTETVYMDEKKMLITRNELYFLKGVEKAPKQIEEPKKEKPEWQKNREKIRNESDLPYSFEYKIRRYFIGKNCPICKNEMDQRNSQPTIQHCLPFSKGGKHELGNIAVICRSCNESIRDRETDKLNSEEVSKAWIAIGQRLDTQVRVRLELGKDNIGEKTAGKAGGVEIWDPKTKEERQQINKVQELANFYLELKGWDNEDREFYEENEISYPRLCKRSKEILELTNGSLEEAKTKVEKIKKWADGNGLEWTLETVQKRWLEIDLLKI